MDEIVRAFVAREPAGLEGAYALWARDLSTVARHVLADGRLAEDCVHDAFLRLWRAPNRFEGNGTMLRAYLIACVRNEALAMLRSRARRDARERKSATLEPAVHAELPLVDPVEAARLRSALATLPPEQRAALELAYYGNKTHVEVAVKLGEPLGTVKSRISLAMRKLHVALATAEGSR